MVVIAVASFTFDINIYKLQLVASQLYLSNAFTAFLQNPIYTGVCLTKD